ncbi:MAG: aspartate--tRNA(Asn) ligase [Clostridiales bacterium]|nr:aspartate--tRNA(Asn) ligase [Clostridiales bacterium]
MDKINGIVNKVIEFDDFKDYENQVISFTGYIHRIREMSDFSFVIIRTKRDVIQCIYSKEFSDYTWDERIVENTSVKITGKVVNSKDAQGNDRFEVQIHNIEVLSLPAEQMPIVINKKQLDNVQLSTALDLRPISLRNPKERAVFKVQEGIARGFREFLQKNDFTEIRTPKIVFAGAEGGANIFKLDYFGKPVYLTQSPQFYKQELVGVYERVFEIAPVFRAEHHDTSRHLNEYISMDFEMGFIDSFYDIMNMETGLLKYIFELLNKEYKKELDLLKVQMPTITEIPVIKFMDAKDLIVNKFKKHITDFNDFEPEEEQLLGKWAKDNYNSDFLFVTHYPSKKRPFYAMDDPENPEVTLSFDLLFRGVEITTGGQRIHDYNMQVKKMQDRGMKVEEFETYLMLHKYGAPPHGGLGLGLERLTMNLLGFKNVRYASMFPRDINRVTP